MALCRAIRARAVALPAAVPAPGVAALFSADAATAGSAATAEGGVYRDRWFNGMHPPREWVHVGLGSAPGGGGAAAAAPISQDEERRRLTSMDLYGTLAQKHVCLSREQLLQMYADVSAIITMSRTTREAVCVFWGVGGARIDWRGWVQVRERTMRAMDGLDEQQLSGESDGVEPSLNPMVWALGHTAHFYETMGVSEHIAPSCALCVGWEHPTCVRAFVTRLLIGYSYDEGRCCACIAQCCSCWNHHGVKGGSCTGQEPSWRGGTSTVPSIPFAPTTRVSQNGYLLSRRGCSLPASVSDFDTHRASISSRFDCRPVELLG
jgi:hypothetical protein